MLGNVHSGQPTVILSVSSTWVLGFVLVIQPTVILRRKSECLDTCQVPFLIKTGTSVTPVTSVIFFADLLFSIQYKSVTSCNLIQAYCFRFYFRSVSVIILAGMVFSHSDAKGNLARPSRSRHSLSYPVDHFSCDTSNQVPSYITESSFRARLYIFEDSAQHRTVDRHFDHRCFHHNPVTQFFDILPSLSPVKQNKTNQ